MIKSYTGALAAGLRPAAALLLLLAAGAAAQQLEPYESNKRFGFRVKGTDTVAVEPIYEAATAYEEGLSRVASGGLWGYVDEKGRVVVEPRFEEARPFKGGAAEARRRDGQWELLGRDGAVLLVASAPALGRLSGGMELFAEKERFGYRNAKGKAAVQPTLPAAGAFSEELAPARGGAKWGFINKSGKFRVEPAFEAVRGYSEGLAAFLRGGRWGYLDKNGREAIRPVFSDALDFSGGLAAVRFNTWWGYIDPQGRVAVAPDYTRAGPFSGGLAAVSLPGGGRRWITPQGAMVYESAGDAGDGLEILVSSAGRYGLARAGVPLGAPAYEDVAGCREGLCLARLSGRMVFATPAGSVTLRTDFDSGRALGCGLYRVGRDGKFGLLNSAGQPLGLPVYEAIEGDGCGGELQAVFESTSGRLALPEAVFTAGPAVPTEPVVVISSRCRDVAPSLAVMNYADIPAYCGAAELGALLKNYPDCLSCRLAVAAIHSSTAASPAGLPADAEAALASLEEVIQLSTGSPWLYSWRADLLLSTSAPAANAARAINEYRELIRLEPSNGGHYRDICAAYALLPERPADYEQGLAYCNEAVKNETGSVDSLISRADYRRLGGDIAGAQDDYRAAIQQAPADPKPRLARAKFSEGVQDYRVVFDCTKALESSPDNAELLERRAMAYLRMGACPKALPDIEAVSRLAPGPTGPHMKAAYYWKCDGENLLKTMEALEEILRAAPQSWQPEKYSRFLASFYQTAPYREKMRQYFGEQALPPPAPGAPAVPLPASVPAVGALPQPQPAPAQAAPSASTAPAQPAAAVRP